MILGYLKRLDNYNEEITFKKANEEHDPIRDKSQRLKVETVGVDSDDPYDNDYYSKVIDQVPTPLSLRYLKGIIFLIISAFSVLFSYFRCENCFERLYNYF
jgi:hypothetical protein